MKGADGKITSTLFWSDRLELTLLRREAESYLSEGPRKRVLNRHHNRHMVVPVCHGLDPSEALSQTSPDVQNAGTESHCLTVHAE